MRREPKAFLWDNSTAIDAVLTFTEGFDEDAYRASPLVKSAVERQLEIIGEALSQLAKVDVAMFAQIPERRPAIELRNVLIHGYVMVDDGLVWRAVAKDLPALRERVVTLLEPEKAVAAQIPAEQTNKIDCEFNALNRKSLSARKTIVYHPVQ